MPALSVAAYESHARYGAIASVILTLEKPFTPSEVEGPPTERASLDSARDER